MRGSEIAEKLRVSHQRVRQLVTKLHAQGHVTFGDPENPFWIIRRADDRTPLLSRDEEHVLSAIPREYVTNVTKIRLAARMSENKVLKILEALIAGRFVEEFKGLRGSRVYDSPRPVKVILNAINLLVAQRCHACLLNQTVFAKCFRRSWTRGRCASEM
jgi:DNA-binding MarR family transcriptional regulator